MSLCATGMFTSCCNWMCEDSAEEQQADEGQGAGRHQSYTNSAFSTQPSPPPPPELTCKTCRGRLDTPAKKVTLTLSPAFVQVRLRRPDASHFSPPVPQHVCVDCKKNYCSSCSAHLEPRPRLCHTCQRFYGNLLERAELMKLKVKELRDYLHLHGVSTHLCREKVRLRHTHRQTHMCTHTHTHPGCVAAAGGAGGVGAQPAVVAVQRLHP